MIVSAKMKKYANMDILARFLSAKSIMKYILVNNQLQAAKHRFNDF